MRPRIETEIAALRNCLNRLRDNRVSGHLFCRGGEQADSNHSGSSFMVFHIQLSTKKGPPDTNPLVGAARRKRLWREACRKKPQKETWQPNTKVRAGCEHVEKGKGYEQGEHMKTGWRRCRERSEGGTTERGSRRGNGTDARCGESRGPMGGSKTLVIFESELCVMAKSTYEFGDLETGGYLYGAYTNETTIVVMLATLAGQGAVHRPNQFIPDLAQVHRDDQEISKLTGLCVVGRYHGHTCVLDHSSPVDDASRRALLRKNPRQQFLELILCPDVVGHGAMRLYAYACEGDSPDRIVPCQVTVLPGYSPIRMFLRGTPAIPSDDDRHIFAGNSAVIDPMLSPQADALIERLSTEITELPEEVAATVEVEVGGDNTVVSITTDDHAVNICYPATMPDGKITAAIRDADAPSEMLDTLAVPSQYSLAEILAWVRRRMESSEDHEDYDGEDTGAYPPWAEGDSADTIAGGHCPQHGLSASSDADSLPMQGEDVLCEKHRVTSETYYKEFDPCI
jgi:hypothetical protein